MVVSFRASRCMLQDAANLELPRMRDTSRHKSAVKETLNSAITLPAVLHKPRLRPSSRRHLCAQKTGRKEELFVG